MTEREKRVCALESCDEEFAPGRVTQLYCRPEHGRRAANERRRRLQEPLPLDELGSRAPTQAEAITALEAEGYVVTKPRPQEAIHEFDLSRIRGRKRVRICAVSDTHLCSTYQQLTFLEQTYQYAEKEAEVDAFIHGGDLTDGPHHMHRDAPYNLFRHGYDAQKEYVVSNYPHSNKPTYVLGGNHDAATFNQVGADIVAAICDEREDLHYLGDQRSAYLDFGNVRTLITHPYIAGSTITLSRPAQRVIEQIAPEHKPHVLFVGNWHRYINFSYRNVEAIQLPSFQATTPFMRGKGLHSEVGAVIVEFGLDSYGTAGSFKLEHLRFFQPIPEDYPHTLGSEPLEQRASAPVVTADA